MNKAIYNKWKEYTSENQVEVLDEYLKELASQAVGLDIRIGYDEETMGLVFYIRAKTEILSLCGCPISKNLNNEELKKEVKDNHEIYLQLLQELFGEKAIYNQGVGTYEQLFSEIYKAKNASIL